MLIKGLCILASQVALDMVRAYEGADLWKWQTKSRLFPLFSENKVSHRLFSLGVKIYRIFTSL